MNLTANSIKKEQRKTEDKDHITGYIEAVKIGKVTLIADKSINLTNYGADDIIERRKGLFSFFESKEKTKFKLYKTKTCIEDWILPSITESIQEAFNHVISIGQITAEEKLAYYTAKAINIIICGGVTSLFVKTKYKGEQKDIMYVDKIQVYREVKYSAIEMKGAFKKYLPDVFNNIKSIQEFPNNKIELLTLTPEEEAIMTMLKKQWKAIPVSDIHNLDGIQQKIQAYHELE